MTERMRLISYLLYGLFSAILKKSDSGSNFPHLLAHAMAFFLAHTKEVSDMLVFLSAIENIVVLCPSFLLLSPTRSQLYFKEALSWEKKLIMPGHYKN